jgi:hypothetical protein
MGTKKDIENQIEGLQKTIVRLRAENERSRKSGDLDRQIEVIVHDGEKGFHKLTFDYNVESREAQIVDIKQIQSEAYRAEYEASILIPGHMKSPIKKKKEEEDV